jgi:predicted acetyltransferase
VILYLGYFDDTPVATSFLHMGGSSAGLWWVVTLEKVRRSGIGTWMTVNSLREAHEKGYNLGVLYATELGYPIYKKLGFKDYYTLQNYIYNPTNQ